MNLYDGEVDGAAEKMSGMVAVVVLYRQLPEESVALRTLQALRASRSEWTQDIHILLWDNTPGSRVAPEGFDGTWHHAADNPGLAAAYNTALQLAESRSASWLMLLDQDTDVTAEYLEQVFGVIAQNDSPDAIVPRLMSRGAIASPFYPALTGPILPIEPTLFGTEHRPVQAFNSGAVLSVKTMRAVQGFDAEFPLDYLDHATFAKLQQHGARVYVLPTILQHPLATDTGKALDAGALRRQRDILPAEMRFYRKYGSDAERSATKSRLLRRAASVLVHKRDVRHAWMILMTLVRG